MRQALTHPPSLRGARVLMVSSSYPFSRADYHALFVHELARALVEHGAIVRVLTPATPGGGPAQERWEGVEVRRFSYPGLAWLPLTGGEGMVENVRAAPLRALTAPALMAAFVSAIKRAAAEFQPDVVITHWLVPTGLALALARLGVPTLHVPTLHVAHSSDVHLLARLPMGRLVSRMIARTGRVLATSEALRERLRSAGLVDDPLSWHLPLSLPRAPLVRHHDDNAPLEVVAMSRLIDGKGLSTLIAAVARLPSVHLRIAGAGPLKSRLEQEIAALDVSQRVSLVGAVLGEAKAELLASADVFAFVPAPSPGSFEDNLPISVLEAMAHGVPLLATKVGGLPRLLSNGGGALVDPDVRSVASALERWAACDRSELCRQARATAERFSVESSIHGLERALA